MAAGNERSAVLVRQIKDGLPRKNLDLARPKSESCAFSPRSAARPAETAAREATWEHSMSRLKTIGLSVVLAIAGGSAAHAARGYSTADVNMRTGPDTEFPVVVVIPEGTLVDVRGCLEDESWCDVIWGPNRGWVFSEYLGFADRGEYVPLPDFGLGALRIPVVTFNTRIYWDRYYVRRPWYRDRLRWYDYTVRPREGWRAPPPGRRVPGWWRLEYKAYPGMRIPVERWRRIERRLERREDRREWRQERRERRQDRREERRDRR
jgi:uncharacterized protein YraI